MGGFRFLIAAAMSFAAMHACDQSKSGPDTPRPSGTSTKTDTSTRGASALGDPVTYDSWVKDYLTKNCTRCHSPQGNKSPDLTSYSNAKNFAQLSLESMKDGSMPPAGAGQKATQDQIKRMEAWITGGTLEKKTSSAPPSTGSRTGASPATPTTNPSGSVGASSALTWTRDIQPIYSRSCGTSNNGCHSTQAISVDLTTLAAAKRHTLGTRTRVNSGDMPRGGRLSEADKQKIITWVNQGAN